MIDRNDAESYAQYRDTVRANIENFREVTSYDHQISATYRLPLDKFPLIDFTTADIRYQSTYRWDRAPFAQDSLGHTIQNSRNITLNAAAQFKKLYDKVPILKDINSGKRKREWEKEQEKKRKEIDLVRKRYDNGLYQLETAGKAVEGMQAEIIALQPELE